MPFVDGVEPIYQLLFDRISLYLEMDDEEDDDKDFILACELNQRYTYPDRSLLNRLRAQLLPIDFRQGFGDDWSDPQLILGGFGNQLTIRVETYSPGNERELRYPISRELAACLFAHITRVMVPVYDINMEPALPIAPSP